MRCLTRLIVVAAIIAVLATIADVAARRLVEDRVAEQIRSSQGLTGEPEVDVHGWPFVTQLISGDFQEVQVTSGRAGTAEGLQVDSVDARLREVSLPLGELISGTPAVEVGSVTVTGVVPYSTVSRVLAGQLGSGFSDLDVTHRSGDTVTLGGSYRGLPVEVPVRVRLNGTQVVFAVPEDAAASSPALAAVARLVSVRVAVPVLPYGIRVRSLEVTDGGLRLGASATDVRLQG